MYLCKALFIDFLRPSVYGIRFIFMKPMDKFEDGTGFPFHVLHRKSLPGEVWYDKADRWLCLECHMVVKEQQKLKEVSVRNIFQKCSRCSERTPYFFCYDGPQFLREKCEQKAQEKDVCVSNACYIVIMINHALKGGVMCTKRPP